jgi:hypothetical protein
VWGDLRYREDKDEVERQLGVGDAAVLMRRREAE